MQEAYVLSIVRVGMLANMQLVQAKGKRKTQTAQRKLRLFYYTEKPPPHSLLPYAFLLI